MNSHDLGADSKAVEIPVPQHDLSVPVFRMGLYGKLTQTVSMQLAVEKQDESNQTQHYYAILKFIRH